MTNKIDDDKIVEEMKRTRDDSIQILMAAQLLFFLSMIVAIPAFIIHSLIQYLVFNIPFNKVIYTMLTIDIPIYLGVLGLIVLWAFLEQRKSFKESDKRLES